MVPVIFLQHFDQNYNKQLFTLSLSSQWKQWPRYFSLEPKASLNFINRLVQDLVHYPKLACGKYTVTHMYGGVLWQTFLSNPARQTRRVR